MRFSFPRAALVLLLGGTVLSCAASVFQLSADEQELLQSAMTTPLTFVVPRSDAIASWDRAVDFLNRYSTMKLRTAADSVITSYEQPPTDPTSLANAYTVRFGYSIRRARDPEGIQYAVQCTPSTAAGAKDAEQNAHIAAYYIKSGSVCDRCIVR